MGAFLVPLILFMHCTCFDVAAKIIDDDLAVNFHEIGFANNAKQDQVISTLRGKRSNMDTRSKHLRVMTFNVDDSMLSVTNKDVTIANVSHVYI